MRPRGPVLAQIGFVGGDEQVALRDRRHALRSHARGQALQQLGRSRVDHVIDKDDAAAFGRDKSQLLAVIVGGDDRLRLSALFARPGIGVMADPHQLAVQRVAGIVHHAAVAVPDGEPARAAFPVAFVRSDQVVVVQPCNRVGFARHGLETAGPVDLAVLFGVDAVQIDGPGVEMGRDLAVCADDDDVVVFLQGDRQIARRVEGEIFGLGVFRHDFGQPGHVDDLLGGAIRLAIRDRDADHEARGHLRDGAVVQFLVALVLDGDGQHVAGGRDRDAVRLTAQIAAVGDAAGREIDGAQHARRIGKGFRGVHADKAQPPGHDGGGRLAVHCDIAQRLGRARIGDVHEAQRPQRAVGIDQRVAISCHGEDFGRAFAGAVLALGHVV